MAYQFAFIDESLRRHAESKRFVQWLSKSDDYQQRLDEVLSEMPAAERDDAVGTHITETHAFLHGEVYVVSSQITDLVRSASLTLPSDTFIPYDTVPSQFGVLIFEKPLLGMGMTDPPAAIAWAVGPVQDKFDGVERTCILMSFREWDAPHSFYVASSGVGMWPMDGTLGKLEASQSSVSHAWRFMAALFLFMNDKILTTSTRPASRSMQRRLARAKNIDIDAAPTARVIELRQREYVQGEARETTDREYMCQWIVRGHWRNQWLPSQGTHQPRWIMPYVKGPTDKPLKTPKRNVFAVVR